VADDGRMCDLCETSLVWLIGVAAVPADEVPMVPSSTLLVRL
jgi:hypothetical protein